MKLDRSILLGIVLGAFAALAASAHAQVTGNPSQSLSDERPSALQEEFQHTYPLNPGGRIELHNINGRVTITSWNRNEVKVDALKYAGTRERLAEASIDVQADPSSIYIKTRYQDHDLTFTDDDPIHNPASVDYTLTVPADARLDAIKLVNGDLDIQNISGEVDARCINGRLRATGLRGRTNLSTVNGTLDVKFEKVNPEREANLKSVNGSLVLTLPSDADAEVRARTVSGFINNDFGLPVHDGRYVGHSLAGRLGSGAARIDLKNVNGSISLQRASDGKPLRPVTNLLPPKRDEMD